MVINTATRWLYRRGLINVISWWDLLDEIMASDKHSESKAQRDPRGAARPTKARRWGSRTRQAGILKRS